MSSQLKIGERDVTVPALNGFKAVRAGRLVAEASEIMPDVNAALAELRQRYATDFALKITPQMAKLPRFQRTVDGETRPLFSEEDFQAAGGAITIPQDPPRQEVILAVFPIAFKSVEKQLVELLALVIAPNRELEEQDEAGTVDEYLAREGKKLLHQATIDQLIELAIAAIEQVSAALSGDSLGKAVAAVTGQQQPRESQPVTAPEATQPSTPESPTGSPEPMAGHEQTVSTEHRGEKSESLPNG